MISSISFKGTYKVDNKNADSFAKFRDYAHSTHDADKELGTGVKIGFKEEFVPKGYDIEYRAEQTLIVPDYMDADVEKFCAITGISYKKYDTKDLLSPAAVTSRVAKAPEGYRKVSINAEKLENLIKNQDSNIEHCRDNYDEYYFDTIDTMLKNGGEFPATTVHISNHSGNENLKRYVNAFGVDRLNKDQLFVDFDQRTNTPDHCVYFALRNLGLNKIPVYVDNQSFEAGKILGLFESDK